MLDIETAACNLCGATDSAPLLIDATHHAPGEFVLRRCAQCGLIYLSPRPTPNSICPYYPPDYLPYRRPIEDERSGLMRRIRRRMVEKHTRVTRGRILDVGCAKGYIT